MKINLEDVVGKEKWEISLSKLVGQPIKDVSGYITMDDDENLLFELTGIEFGEGSLICDGDYECAYVYAAPHKAEAMHMDEDTLRNLYEQSVIADAPEIENGGNEPE